MRHLAGLKAVGLQILPLKAVGLQILTIISLQSILTFHNTVYFDLSLYHRVYVYYRLRPSAKELRIILRTVLLL